MKKITVFLTCLIGFSTTVFANPACIVCTVAIGTTLSIARKLGVDDNVIGLWLGAILVLFGYWSIWWFNKKNWHFYARDPLLMLASFSLIGGIYIKDLTYTPQVIAYVLYLDPFLFTGIIGAFIYIFSQKFYAFLKEKNGGHAHFPFEKVVLPLGLLVLTSIYITYFPICS